MSFKQLIEWEVFHEYEPWGTEVEDHRAGVLARLIAEPNRNTEAYSEPFDESDFFTRLKPKYTAEEKAEYRRIQAQEEGYKADAEHSFFQKYAAIQQQLRDKQANV